MNGITSPTARLLRLPTTLYDIRVTSSRIDTHQVPAKRPMRNPSLKAFLSPKPMGPLDPTGLLRDASPYFFELVAE